MRKELAYNVMNLLALAPGFPPLGPERRSGVKSVAELEASFEVVFSEAKGDDTQRDLVRAIVLLWHDHLDESHRISQNIPDADGSFVHGIMHRREPDYGNAKYWFHRVGAHPIFPALGLAAIALEKEGGISKQLLDRLVFAGKAWDPFAFIDAVEEARRKNASDAIESLRSLQASETMLLLGHVIGVTRG